MREKVSEQFVFNNRADELYPLALHMAGFITQNASIREDVLSKLKMVLVELLTNSLKHSGREQAVFQITLMEDKIVIIKTDTGHRLNIANFNEITGVKKDSRLYEIYGDNNGALMCHVHKNNRVSFFVKCNNAKEVGEDVITTLTEHFGLMIITKACHTFEYGYDDVNKANVFTAILKFK